MPPKRKLYIVYEPPTRDGLVPYPLQRIVGFSHAKLLILKSGSIRSNGTGDVYDMWKEGKASIGNNSGSWRGLGRGEKHVRIGETNMSSVEIRRTVRAVLERMGSYNLLYSNCEDFAQTLARALDRELDRQLREYSNLVDAQRSRRFGLGGMWR